MFFTPYQQLKAQSSVQSYWESVHQNPSSLFPPSVGYSPPKMVDQAVVCISGDTQQANKFVVPLKIPHSNITLDALVNTGSQGCFINK